LNINSGRAEPEVLLSDWGVSVGQYDFSSTSVDAIAYWAHDHSPRVLWNPHVKHTSNEGARRATLSHEICHLLVDRSALPLTAVVGGAMERRLEQRANAFAAEFLCPRREAAAEYQRDRDVVETIHRLTDRFGVSDELATLQLARSGQYFSTQGLCDIEELGPPGASYPWSR
jgi:Zn-dependent peptidase ImmA (M78 family)